MRYGMPSTTSSFRVTQEQMSDYLRSYEGVPDVPSSPATFLRTGDRRRLIRRRSSCYRCFCCTQHKQYSDVRE